GERVGIVGPNGAGKTTLFRMITREEIPDEGSIELPRRLTIGYFRQDVGDMAGRTVIAETMAGAGEVGALDIELKELEDAMTANEGDMDRVLERYGEVQARYEELGGYDLENRARVILDGLSFREAAVDGDVGALSGGWKMRVALARLLLASPDVLLLDEPTNYLDIESILWLESFLKSYKGTVVMTCHDREVMNRVVGKIIEIDGGEIRVYTGDFDFYEQQREQQTAQRAAAWERQQAMLAKEMRFVERFKAQAAKAAQVQSRVKKLDKIERLAPPRRLVERTFHFEAAGRSGDDVIRAENLCKSFGDLVVHDDLSLLVKRKHRWAVMGANGAGKSTLLKMMAGLLQPDSGEVTIGAAVTMGYFAQHLMEQLNAKRTVFEELQHHAPTAGIGTLRSLAGAFGFMGEDADKSLSHLSGGEKARVALARILYDAPNLMVLDEPTNHLDATTKKSLIKALSKYEGTIVFVSHDRAFLRAVATHVLELGEDGVHVYPGSYDEYVTATGHEAPGMRAI
ncbi:MAG TPA: ABC-F family ATP-binding cassette domain-containing protein, partial [Myxococcales bacterium]|nr:ABC-F family ATP-binding cassette domain-containing protein [Myxococcales bacterium]